MMFTEEIISFTAKNGKIINNELFVNNHKTDSLVVLFPGGNYGCDKPLLYYARKAAFELGKDVLCVSYSKKISKDDIESKNVEIIGDEVQKVIDKALAKEYKNIYFISKSIGTEVAGYISEKYSYKHIKFLFLTPTIGTIKHITKGKCTVIVGNSDGLFPQNNIVKISGLNSIELKVIENGNHSLEVKGNVVESIDALKGIINIYLKFLA